MGEHLNAEGEFQSDKYPTCPAGKFPISTKDQRGQDLLWEYAERAALDGDKELANDLKAAIKKHTGGKPPFKASMIVALARKDVTDLILKNQHLPGSEIFRLIVRSFPLPPEVDAALAAGPQKK